MARSSVPLTLYSWEGRWKLPTIDPFCLGVQTYLSLSNASWSLYNVNDPTISPNGELPLLKVGEHQVVAGSESIIQQLQIMGYDMDIELSQKQQADAIAYRTMVDHILYEAQLYEWFQIEKNFTEVVRPVYSQMSPIYTRYIVPIRMRNAARERLANAEYKLAKKTRSNVNENEVEANATDKKTVAELSMLPKELIIQVRNCYAALSTKLNNQTYIFGEKPSSLDAIVYGHLAIHLYADEFQHSTLRPMLIREFPNLVAYCDRIRALTSSMQPKALETCPPLPATLAGILALPGRVLLGGDGWRVMQEYWTNWRQKKTGNRNESRVNKANESMEVERPFYQKRWFSILGGVSLMIGYMVWNNIISIEFASDDEQEEDMESEDEEDNANIEEFPTLTSEDLLKSVF
ncbi:hypothetical protein BDF22DRAFT_117529 [Syncephalis plumigaleata]|nr:hypothetical protein BDF22DRAFT_117529 [Syncephalis plumigaleata]